MSWRKIKCGGVYLIEVGEYFYIGKSTNVFDRWNSHYGSLVMGNHSSPLLQEKFNEVGINGLRFSVLEWVSLTEYKKTTGYKGEELKVNYNKYLLIKEKDWMRRWGVNFALNKMNKHFG